MSRQTKGIWKNEWDIATPPEEWICDICNFCGGCENCSSRVIYRLRKSDVAICEHCKTEANMRRLFEEATGIE